MKKSILFRALATGLTAAAAPCFADLPAHIIADTNFHPILDRTTTGLGDWQVHSSNWKTQYLGTDSATIYTDGLTHPSSMTHLIYNYATNRNIEVRFTFRMPNVGGSNMGFQFRSRCQTAGTTLANNCGGTPWILCGPQMDLGPSYAGDIYNGCVSAYVNSGTVSSPPRIVNNNPTCKAGLDITQWNNYRFRLYNDTAWTYRNNVLCSKYFLTAATDVRATTQGMISLQYETLVKAEWKSIEIKNLDTPTPLSQSRIPIGAYPALQGGPQSLSFGIPESGAYSVEVSDLKGGVVRFAQGVGPVSHGTLALKSPGVYFVKVRTPAGISTGKVAAY